MITERALALGKKRSTIREIFEYSMRRKREIGEENVFDFSLGNPSVPSPQAVTDCLKELIENETTVALHGYTSAAGAVAVREKIAKKIYNRFDFKANPELIYMTCGAAASLSCTLSAIAGEKDEVLVLSPYFPEYRVFIENAGATVVEVPTKRDTFTLDIEKIKNAINKKTRAIIINSPCNPTGVVYSEDDIIALSDLLKEKREQYGTHITVIADEPYREIVYGDVFVPYIPNYYDDTVVCYSYSKSLSVPGERIGYIMVSPKMQCAQDVFYAVCGAARSMGYVCAPSMWQRVVAECDGIAPNIEAYNENRTLLYNALTEIGFTAVKPEGAFYLFLKSPMPDAKEFCEKAKEYELLLVPSDDFGCGGYVRIAYCVEKSVIERAIPAFRELYKEIKNG